MRSADQGYAPAQTALGLAYETGMGVEKDERQAVRFYRLAAEKEDSSAQYYLGKALYDGTGIKDYEEAVSWLKKSSDKNNDDAQVLLGLAYFYGNGVEKDDTASLILC